MYARILVPLDDSPTGERGLQEALRIASALKSTLVLLHILDDLSYQVEMAAGISSAQLHKESLAGADALLARAAKAAAEVQVPSESVLRDVKNVRVAEVILEEAAARKCDLIVMGTHGRRGLTRMALGSDAEQVVRKASVPVTLVRQPDEER